MKKIVIVGGGLTGCSTAFHLAQAGAAEDVVVIEADPSYEFAATPRSVGGVRTVFGVPQNVQMSLFAFEVFKDISAYLGLPKDSFDAGFRKQGYMYAVSGAEQFEQLRVLQNTMQSAGATSELLDQAEMQNRFPQINFEDMSGSVFSARDGAVDPNAVFQGFRRSTLDSGVQILTDRVIGFDCDDKKVHHVKLCSGEEIDCDIVLNAANYRASEISAMVGMKVPIEPLPRQTFYFDCQADLDPFPVIRDHTGFVIRPEGRGYLTGLTDRAALGTISHDVDHSLFETELWPRLAERCPAFEAVRMRSGWAGIYDVNTLDGNPIIGPWTGGLANFHIAAGFSGHGLQHGPAVGRGLAELMLNGRFETLDLSPFGYRRILDGRQMPDFGPNA
ncbi:MAG: FAD-binding oxidoreductase [Roseovarius sp.]|nr:FAD-binding oxidoreductase [Roseovarius sp.]